MRFSRNPFYKKTDYELKSNRLICITSTKRLDGTRLLGKFSLCFRFLTYLSLCTFFLLFGILLITLLCFLFRSAVAFR